MKYKDIHLVSSNHRDLILKSNKCGCFYCLATFSPDAIVEWTDKGQTALCPECYVDSVIAEDGSFELTDELLKEMRTEYFS